VTDLTQVMVRRAAELTTAVEMARADMITGVPTDMIALVRLEGVAARAVRVVVTFFTDRSWSIQIRGTMMNCLCRFAFGRWLPVLGTRRGSF
jgi:hypothetical protein